MMAYRKKTVCCFIITVLNIAQLWQCSAANAGDQTYVESMFLTEIFKLYGERNASFITPKSFKVLLQQLTLGNVYIEKLDKFCLYKGIHNGYKEEPRKADEVAKKQSVKKLSRRRRSGDHDEDHEQIENPKHMLHLKTHLSQCLSQKILLQRHNLSDTAPLSRTDFIKICPALIQQINSGFCIHRHNCSEKPYYLRIVVNENMVWVYGFVAITVVSLSSLCIIAIIPCLEKSFYQRIMGYLVALAIGTLAGDALLHLIPHAFQSLLSSSEAEHRRNIWKSLFVLVGMYAFFLVEQLMKTKQYMKCCTKKGKSTKHSHQPESKHEIDISEMKFKDLNDKDSEDRLRESSEVLPTGPNSPATLSETELLSFPAAKGPHQNHDPHNHLEYHDHHKKRHNLAQDHGHSHGKVDRNTSIATVAWMVIFGDGFHNFSDGLAIGAAFAASYSSGISTAIAVFCHELPHEIGDFAVLIKSGMTIKQAICYNLVSALLSYVGLVIGILIGNYSDDGKQFALALTAGLFLYVALANMLPELTSSMADDVGDIVTFVSPHLGIISGITIMLLISIYEENF